MTKNDLPNVVFISGPDGVGKTTQARLLRRHYEANGHQARYVWLRFNHLVVTPILAYMKIRGLSYALLSSNGSRTGVHSLSKGSALAYCYVMASILDMWLATLIKIRLPMLRGFKIICDRHVLDAIIDISIAVHDQDFHKSKLGRMFINLIPRRGKTVVIMADTPTLRQRRPENDDDPSLAKRVVIYRLVAAEHRIQVLESSALSEHELSGRIIGIITEPEEA